MKPRVLVVEDSPELVAIYTMILSSLYDLHVVTGKELRDGDAIRDHVNGADLVICDHSGVPFEAVKQMAKNRNKPFLLVSGDINLEQYCVPCLEKPFNARALVEKVQQLLAA